MIQSTETEDKIDNLSKLRVLVNDLYKYEDPNMDNRIILDEIENLATVELEEINKNNVIEPEIKCKRYENIIKSILSLILTSKF